MYVCTIDVQTPIHVRCTVMNRFDINRKCFYKLEFCNKMCRLGNVIAKNVDYAYVGDRKPYLAHSGK